jgi:hypothetical protein
MSLTPEQFSTWQTLTQLVMQEMQAQAYGQGAPIAAPSQNPMLGGMHQPQAMSPVPQALPGGGAPTTAVTESGVHVGRLSVWQSAADKKTSYNGEMTMHSVSGDPRNPDAKYKVFLERNVDPSKGYAHAGDVVLLNPDGTTGPNVGKVRVVNNTMNQNPSVVAHCYVDFDNGFSISGPLHREGGQSSTGARKPDVVGNLYYNAVAATQPAAPQPAPAQMPAPTFAPAPMPVAPNVQLAVPQMPQVNSQPADMQAFFTQPPAQVPTQQQMPQPQQPPAMPQSIAQMSPQQLAAFAMQAAQQQQGPQQGGM